MTPRAELPEMMHFCSFSFSLFPLQSCPFPSSSDSPSPMPLPSSLPHTAPRQNQPPITPDKEGGDAIAGARQDAKPHQVRGARLQIGVPPEIFTADATEVIGVTGVALAGIYPNARLKNNSPSRSHHHHGLEVMSVILFCRQSSLFPD